ncbi:hypothetical protein TNCV_1401071 [Trichonephila clavipes]|nr:hypothetical protein TNCV_1401071 [Trichonephila clavipes]
MLFESSEDNASCIQRRLLYCPTFTLRYEQEMSVLVQGQQQMLSNRSSAAIDYAVLCTTNNSFRDARSRTFINIPHNLPYGCSSVGFS